MILTVAVCALFLLVGFGIKHTPHHPRSIRRRDQRLIKKRQDQ